MGDQFPVTSTIVDPDPEPILTVDGEEEGWVAPEITAAREGHSVNFGKNITPVEGSDKEE